MNADWVPHTELGRKVMNGSITSLDEIFALGKKIKEAEIIDKLLPGIQSDVIFIGGTPGKGGGIRRTPTKRTARMHRSGRRYKVSAMVVIGNGDGYIGVGMSQALEHRVVINKATKNAKLNIIPVKRGCGSWECACSEKHSIPMKISGRSGSIKVVLIPAPKGAGLVIHDEGKKVMKMAGIHDVWLQSFGNTRARNNYTLALFDAFKSMNKMKVDVPEKKQKQENGQKKVITNQINNEAL